MKGKPQMPKENRPAQPVRKTAMKKGGNTPKASKAPVHGYKKGGKVSVGCNPIIRGK